MDANKKTLSNLVEKLWENSQGIYLHSLIMVWSKCNPLLSAHICVLWISPHKTGVYERAFAWVPFHLAQTGRLLVLDQSNFQCWSSWQYLHRRSRTRLGSKPIQHYLNQNFIFVQVITVLGVLSRQRSEENAASAPRSLLSKPEWFQGSSSHTN